MSAGPRNRLVRALLRAPVGIFRVRLGWLFGGRLLLLETVGRVSGQPRRTVIEVVRADRTHDQYWVVAGWGRRSDWYLNALAHPPLQIDSGRRRIAAPVVHELDQQERTELLADYQRRNPRTAKALGRRLLGQDFVADDDAISQLAEVTGALRLGPSSGT